MHGKLRSEQELASWGIFFVGGMGMLLVILFSVVRSQQPTVVAIMPTRTGETERCLTCHSGIESISVSHSTADFGCVACHNGDRLAIDEATAHIGLVKNPSNPENAQQYCGDCHAAQILMMDRSIMTTYAGAIALIRRTYGLQPGEEAEYAAHAVGELEAFSPSPSDPQHVHDFAANCMTCHTSAEPQSADYFYRSTGCASCHVLYADDGLYQGSDPTISQTEPGHAQTHEFTTSIPYTQCNHCHNRGNYDLRTMSFLPRTDVPADPPLTGDAQRQHDYYQPIGQFTRCEYELDCIDCHTQQEVMGNGVLHNNRSEASYVQCSTCHGTLDAPPIEYLVQSDDDVAMTRANLNALIDLAVGDTIMATDRNEPLYHIQRVGEEWILTGKVTGQTYSVPLVQNSQCQQNPNEQVSSSCHQCHTIDREALP